MAENNREVWLHGALPNMPALLQPVAHALLQAREEIHDAMKNFDEKNLWQKPAGVASVGFHLQHLTGVLDRIFTYALGEKLSQQQLEYLASEGKATSLKNEMQIFILRFDEQIDKAIEQLKNTEEQTLKQKRGVGRAQLPSTTIGLLFHAAEHTMRHLGQLLVTAKIVSEQTRDVGAE